MTEQATAAKQHILSGYRVLDFSQYLAGPTVTRLMAEMGAEVIKVEIAPYGDPTRAIPFMKNKRSGYYVQHNRGKKSLCMDIKDERAKKVLVDLIEKSDVLLQNFSPGVMERMGLGWEDVHKINPKIVMCSISAYGQTGPLSNRPGFDYIAQAFAAITDVIGEADGPPVLPQLAMGDVGTGVHAVTAVGFALLDRTRTGMGQHIDVSLLDSYFHQHDMGVQMNSLTGGEYVPVRAGAHHVAACPTGIFKAKDGYIMLTVMNHQWPPMCEAMGLPDMAIDPRFDNNDARVENMAEVIAAIEGWMQSLESDAAAIAILEAARVPCAPVLSVPEVIDHPHMKERGTVRTINDAKIGEFEIPGNPLRFSEYPDPLDLQASDLGEQNAEVLMNVLSYTADQVKELEEGGVLVSR